MSFKNEINPITNVDDVSVLSEKYGIKVLVEDGVMKNLDGTPFTEYPADFAEKKAELIVDFNSRIYSFKRAREYPKLGDQLDALWKGGEALEQMKAQIMAIKEKYPKP